ncbi:DUF6786 family protein [Paenibacillus nasutitermitis]|uniref:Uncharacterized protein n=1 Tax=Paenibacillus nasutitermitis TaxID=1652958 RepID=A0A916ZF63_9BACL|nr:DUF6786 family protein [Paenibacillus nasutitermitis]GGD93447.1 hypothetical protein GCM10010911_60100 [Paenibacillus nasutitermitis]
MKLDDLIASLQRLEWHYRLLRNGEGAVIVALERGGRILGIYPDEELENAAWTNPILADTGASRRLFGLENHWNAGGERVWLSPELEYHVVNPGPPADYTVQRPIDPGAYQFRGGAVQDQCEWWQEGVAKQFRSERQIGFRLAKSCRLVKDPIRFAGLGGPGGYQFVGYESAIDLETNAEGWGNGKEPPLSSWTILQVPAGGHAYAATYGTASPTDFFSPAGPSHLSVSEGIVRFRIDAKQAHKISLTSLQTTGRFGYFRRDESGHCHLIVRQIGVYPSADYLDVPWHDPVYGGHCVQLYNDDGQIGSFGELEHHAPAVQWNEEKGLFARKDVSQTWCYSGGYESLAEVLRLWLGVVI